jgi:hypothetical protein
MKLYPIETGNFKLDGGAMFGLCKKPFGAVPIHHDANNLIIAARCLLIEDGNRLMIDTGMEISNQRSFGYYSLWGHLHG